MKNTHYIFEFPPVDNSDLSYCAGVIDSDGYIGIKRSTYAMRVRGDSTQPIFSERIAVKQVEPQAIDLLKALFGGRRGVERPSAKNGKHLNAWQVTDKQAANCLLALIPFLRIKKLHAENCLALRKLKDQSRRERTCFGRGHVGGKRRPQTITNKMEKLYARSKELNAVGVPKGGDGA
jgi:hypothetical protein